MSDLAIERMPPSEAFDLLGHETRFAILEALNGADEPLTFSDLRASVGVADSGQFNYHLGKLVGPFVHEDEGGYRLSRAGNRVVGAVLSGGYTQTHDAEPIPMTATCPECEAAMETRFADERVVVGCSSCDLIYTRPDVPPGVIEGWEREAVPQVVHRWLHRHLSSLHLGLCPYCEGRVDTAVCEPGDDRAPDWFDEDPEGYEAIAVYDCRRCGARWTAMVEVAALEDPALVGFHHEHGIDLHEAPPWTLDWTDGPRARVTESDPLRVELPVTLEGESRRFVFDETLDLVAEKRE